MIIDVECPRCNGMGEIAERHGLPLGDGNLPAGIRLALIEALLTTPKGETMVGMTEADKEAHWKGFAVKPTPTKPDELPEQALREACEMLNGEAATMGRRPVYRADIDDYEVRTVARLLVRIKELEGPKEDPDAKLADEIAGRLWPDAEGFANRLKAREASIATIKHLREAGWKEGA